VVNVKLYIEGGGDNNKQLRSQCREAFRKLLEKAGFRGRMPRIVACGGRGGTYADFCTALASAQAEDYPILLVDSEDPVNVLEAWVHLQHRDGWTRPAGAEDAQAQLMVTCMETWVIADRTTLKEFFGQCLHEKALPPENNLETRLKEDVQAALENATRDCGRGRQYTKGKRSFELVSELTPDVLRGYLPHFQRLLIVLEDKL
jgi:hypothetical protein